MMEIKYHTGAFFRACVVLVLLSLAIGIAGYLYSSHQMQKAEKVFADNYIKGSWREFVNGYEFKTLIAAGFTQDEVWDDYNRRIKIAYSAHHWREEEAGHVEWYIGVLKVAPAAIIAFYYCIVFIASGQAPPIPRFKRKPKP